MCSIHRTARIRLRVTRGQAHRCYRLLRAGGDVWAALVDVNRERFRRGARPIASYKEWCREIVGVRVGELSVDAMRSVIKRYSDAFSRHRGAAKEGSEPATRAASALW